MPHRMWHLNATRERLQQQFRDSLFEKRFTSPSVTASHVVCVKWEVLSQRDRLTEEPLRACVHEEQTHELTLECAENPQKPKRGFFPVPYAGVRRPVSNPKNLSLHAGAAFVVTIRGRLIDATKVKFKKQTHEEQPPLRHDSRDRRVPRRSHRSPVCEVKAFCAELNGLQLLIPANTLSPGIYSFTLEARDNALAQFVWGCVPAVRSLTASASFLRRLTRTPERAGIRSRREDDWGIRVFPDADPPAFDWEWWRRAKAGMRTARCG